jgi:hypothetical protein
MLSKTTFSIKCRYVEDHYAGYPVLNCYAECHYAEFRYAECRSAIKRMVSVPLVFPFFIISKKKVQNFSITFFGHVILSFIMLSVITPSIIMLIVALSFCGQSGLKQLSCKNVVKNLLFLLCPFFSKLKLTFVNIFCVL